MIGILSAMLAKLGVLATAAVLSFAAGKPEPLQKSRSAFATIASNDYFARGALVALHSLSLHAGARSSSGATNIDYLCPNWSMATNVL